MKILILILACMTISSVGHTQLTPREQVADTDGFEASAGSDGDCHCIDDNEIALSDATAFRPESQDKGKSSGQAE